MNNKNQEAFLILASLLIVVLILFYGGLIKLPPASITPLTGATALSISKVAIVSNNSVVNGSAVILYLVANGGGQSFTATLDPDTFQALTGEVISSPITINVNLENEFSYFNIFDTKQTLSNYDFKCTGLTGSMYLGNIGNVYEVGQISSQANFNYDVQVIVSNGVQQLQTDITPSNQEAILGGVVQVQAVGNLLGNVLPPAPYTSTGLIAKYGSVNWQPVSLNALNNVLNAQSILGSYYCGDPVGGGDCYYWVPTTSCYKNAVQSLNNYESLLNSLPSQQPIVDPTQNCSVVVSGSQPLYLCTPNQPLIYPSLQVIVKTGPQGFVNVVIPSGNPVIVSASTPQPLYARSPGLINILELNNGSQPDSFDTYLNCPSGLTMQGNRISLAPNQQGNVTLTVNSNASQTQLCNVTMVSVGNPALTYTSQFNLTIVNPPCIYDCCVSNPYYQDKPCPSYSFTVIPYALYPNGSIIYLNGAPVLSNSTPSIIQFTSTCQSDNTCTTFQLPTTDYLVSTTTTINGQSNTTNNTIATVNYTQYLQSTITPVSTTNITTSNGSVLNVSTSIPTPSNVNITPTTSNYTPPAIQTPVSTQTPVTLQPSSVENWLSNPNNLNLIFTATLVFIIIVVLYLKYKK